MARVAPGKKRRAPVLAARPRTVSQLLALGELALEYSLREEQAFTAAAEAPQPATVLGLYEAYRPEHGPPEQVYRRITGGPLVEARPGWSYVAAAVPGLNDLQSLAARALGASACLKAPTGFTVAGGTGYMEALTPLPQREALHCIAEPLGLEPRGRIHVPKTSLSELTSLFESTSWRHYRYRRGRAEATVSKEKYWLKISIDTNGTYVTDYWLTGVLYAAPPSEIYTILNTLRGMRLDELTLYNLELAIDKRIQTHGVTRDEIKKLLEQIYNQIGEKYFIV